MSQPKLENSKLSPGSSRNLRNHSSKPSNFQLESLAQDKTKNSSSNNSPDQTSIPKKTEKQLAFFQLKALNDSTQASKKELVSPSSNSNIIDISNSKVQLYQNKPSDEFMEDLFEQIDSPNTSFANIPKPFLIKDSKDFSITSIYPSSSSRTRPRFASTNEEKYDAQFEEGPLGIKIGTNNDTKTKKKTHLLTNAQKLLNIFGNGKKQLKIEEKEEGEVSPMKYLSPLASTKGELQTPNGQENSADFNEKDPENNRKTSRRSPVKDFEQLSNIELTIKPSSSEKKIKKLKFLSLCTGFSLFCTIVIPAFVALVSYNFENLSILLWITGAAHGFFLGASLLVFVHSMSKLNEKELLEERSPIGDLKRDNHDDSRQNKSKVFGILTGFVLLFSSLLGVLLTRFFLYNLQNHPFWLLLIGGIVLIFDTILITIVLQQKNKYAKKEALRKRGNGFFVIPVYKNFLRDLSTTRNFINSTNLPGFVKSAHSENFSANKHDSELKLQKQEYEVITNQRIFGSQLLFILFYLHFVSEVGLAYLYHRLQTNGNSLEVIVILINPLVGAVFKAITELLNNKAKLSMEVHIIYINIIIISIFSKITFLFTENYGFLIFTGLVKIIYKVGSYIRAKRRAESWETNKLDHLGNMVLAQHPRKSKKGSKTREVDKSHNGKNIDHVHNERRTRLNTVMQVKLVENVKVEETRKKNRIKHSNNLMLKFALTEISEITFGLGLIFVVIFFQFFENSSVFISLEDKQVMIYLLSLGCELFISVLSIILLLVFWVRKSKMIDLKFAQIIKPLFRNYFINHCVIYTTFFLFSLSIIQVFYGKLCCIDI